MKVLVTGASGFIGGQLARALVQHGDDVRVLVRATSGINHLTDLPIERVIGDLSNLDKLRQAVAGVKIIYHCAALSSDWGTPAAFYNANVIGVENLIAAARHSDTLDRFLHVSTTDVYGYPMTACDESHPITDVKLPYNTTKGLGEQRVWNAFHTYELPITVIRPVSVYGPRGTEFVLRMGKLIQQGGMMVFDGGRTHAGLLYIDNAVDLIIRAALSPISIGQAYNLRDEINVTWRMYVDSFADALPVRRPQFSMPSRIALPLAHGFEMIHSALHRTRSPLLTRQAVLLLARDQGYAIDKIKAHIGFRNEVSFAEGLDRSVHWFKQQITK